VISVQSISKLLGKKELFSDVSFFIRPGEKVGLIGPNGAGKSTLFRILLGEVEPDTGVVSRPKHVSMGHLPQQWTPLEGKTVLAEVMDVNQRLNQVRSELATIENKLEAGGSKEGTGDLALRQAHLLEQIEHLGGYDLEARAKKILAGLGFDEAAAERPVAKLSGGWAMRVLLARLLLAEPDLLLLDEPTNHLDLESLLWLENYLNGLSSAVILVAHDRAFLNKVIHRILELEQGRVEEYKGNYDYYLQEREQRREIRLAAYRNQQDKLRQMEDFIARNRYRKDRARQVQSRIKQMDKIERVEAPTEEAEIHFSFPEPKRSGKRVLELQNIHKSYGDVEVYRGIDLVVERGDRLALLGENGAGKSTLLKLLAGLVEPTSGERRVGHNVTLGYYAQHQWEQLDAGRTVLAEASTVSGDMAESRLRALLGTFLFRGEDVLKKVSVLSGGEKARLTLCKLLMQSPNVLLLDEPTNHLDIASREVLEQALKDFPGTICFISHDRRFINAIAGECVMVGKGGIERFPGNYDDFKEVWNRRLAAEAQARVAAQAQAAPASARAGGDGAAPTASGDGNVGTEAAGAARSPARKDQERKRLEAQWRNEFYKLKRPLQNKVDELESLLEAAHARLDDVNAALGDPSTYGDGARVQELQKQLRDCQSEVDRLTEQWEEQALELEELEEDFWRDKTAASGG
jgi:ATP-binding cassette subfamily F protein 3